MATTEDEIRLMLRNVLLDVVDYCPPAIETIVRSLVARIKANQYPDACRMALQRLYRRLHDNADPVGRRDFLRWLRARCQNNDAFAASVDPEDTEPASEIEVTP